jgi:hypothetical protein
MSRIPRHSGTEPPALLPAFWPRTFASRTEQHRRWRRHLAEGGALAAIRSVARRAPGRRTLEPHNVENHPSRAAARYRGSPPCRPRCRSFPCRYRKAPARRKRPTSPPPKGAPAPMTKSSDNDGAMCNLQQDDEVNTAKPAVASEGSVSPIRCTLGIAWHLVRDLPREDLPRKRANDRRAVHRLHVVRTSRRTRSTPSRVPSGSGGAHSRLMRVAPAILSSVPTHASVVT